MTDLSEQETFKCNMCHQNGFVCTSYVRNIISLYYSYWLSKITILKDPKNNLELTFEKLNLKRMTKGVIAVVLDYFTDDIVIGNIVDKKYNHNGVLIGAQCQLTLTNYQNKNIYVLDWKIWKNEFLKTEYLKAWGWSNSEVFKTIFFFNNIQQKPSLCDLDMILWNLHVLEDKNNNNHDIINVVIGNTSNKKPTPEQMQNVGSVISTDGRSLWAYNYSDINNPNNVDQSLNTIDLSRWTGIKDELLHWEEKFFEYAGIITEKIKNSGENISETIARFQRVNTFDKQYYKYVELFLKEYQEYFNIELEYELDNVITDSIKIDLEKNRAELIEKQRKAGMNNEETTILQD